MANGFRAEVPPITGRPLPFGLLGGCVEVETVTDPHQLNGTQYRAQGCASANTWLDCPVPPAANPASKVFDRPEYCTSDPVTLYQGVECSTFGLTAEELRADAFVGLSLGEQQALESWFLVNWLCPTAAGNDLTPLAGALNIVQGIGVLENWLAVNYGGVGNIHVPAGAASLVDHARVAHRYGSGTDCPETLLGNRYILGAGYAANVGPATPPAEGCVVAPSGEAWIYITPPVRVRRDTPYLAITNEALSVNTTFNDRREVAETTAVVEVACCMAAAVRVSLCP